MKSKSYFSFFILSLFTLLLLSCEKPYIDEAAGTPATPHGNLTVSVFQLEQTPFSSITRTAPADACTRLNFAVYKPDGSREKQVNQTSTDADFGQATFQLEEGTYQLVVVAHSSNGNPTMTNPAKIQFDNSDGFSDTFLYSEEVTIGGEPLDLSLTLNRIVALCRFVITDDYPQGVAKMQFKYTGGSGSFNASTGQGCVKSTQQVTYDVTAGQKQFDLYTFPYQSQECTIHLTATALDVNSNVLHERTFDVSLECNKISWFSGAFFTTSNTTSTISSLNLNTAWAAESQYNY